MLADWLCVANQEICFWSERKHVQQSISRSSHAVRAASQGDQFPVRANTCDLNMRCESKESHMQVQGSSSFSSELTRPLLPEPNGKSPYGRWRRQVVMGGQIKMYSPRGPAALRGAGRQNLIPRVQQLLKETQFTLSGT